MITILLLTNFLIPFSKRPALATRTTSCIVTLASIRNVGVAFIAIRALAPVALLDRRIHARAIPANARVGAVVALGFQARIVPLRQPAHHSGYLSRVYLVGESSCGTTVVGGQRRFGHDGQVMARSTSMRTPACGVVGSIAEVRRVRAEAVGHINLTATSLSRAIRSIHCVVRCCSRYAS